MKKRDTKQLICNIVIIASLLIFLGAAAMTLSKLWVYWQSDKMNAQLRNTISAESSEASSEPTGENPPANKFTELTNINPNFIGWLEIPDTKINYPVVKGTDNSTYLKTDFYGEPHTLGTVFLDYHANFTQESTSDHLVLYGHSARDGSYFSNVRKYKKLDYYKAHQVISFDTIYEKSSWIILSAYMIDALDSSENAFSYINYTDFSDESAYNEFVSQIQKRNYYKNNVNLQYGDKFLTLSTCDYDFDEARFVITARKIRPNENPNDFLNQEISANPTRLMPEKW